VENDISSSFEIGVSAFRKGSDVTLDLDLGSIGIRQSRSPIRRARS
jgi:hypothetical protein